ncbi:metal-sulfur cluster assembly factor [Actinoplanes subtropicus]|uniref:metal-sulfur cluster assembly factor n=1 Tax=Actinoplanes subtropicus TaxID=543632 RepID=UPI0004C36369|nr:metal-sulfur cluster assembly factor [Actinoplanes subtropicus]
MTTEQTPAWLAEERAAAGNVADAPDVDLNAAAEKPALSKASIADIEEAMKDVVDPELGINVVDLGLVYGTFVDDENVATLDMTLTSAACPLTDVIEEQTRAALTTGPGGGLVSDFRINWVWLPPWGPDKITDDGREQLRALGFNV